MAEKSEGISTGMAVAIGFGGLVLGAGLATAYFIYTADEPSSEKSSSSTTTMTTQGGR
jgi:hypothetical protein